ncbi:MAG: hypothetical protein WEB57_10010 [Pseudohongiellaceae bacterium]
MKHSILPGLVFLFSALFTFSAYSETLVEYDIGALSSWDGDGLNAPSWGVANNVDASPIRVTGKSGYGNYNRYRWGHVKSNLWVERWPPESKMGAVYYEWTVSAEPGHVLNLDDISVGVGNETHKNLVNGSWVELRYQGPRNFRLYSSIEGFGGEDYIASVKTAATGVATARATERIAQERLYADLGEKYKNVSSVTFRVYGFFEESRYDKTHDRLTNHSIAGAGLSKFATGVLFQGAGGGSYLPDGRNGNVVVRGSVGDANQSGRIVAGPRDLAPVNLSTEVTTAGEAVDVLEFTLVNQDKGDAAPLDVARITVRAWRRYRPFDPGKITWRLNGPGSDGVIGVYDPRARAITFDAPDIQIENGTEQTYTVDAHFNDNTGVSESENIWLEIEGRDSVHVTDNGTRMLSGETVKTRVSPAIEVTQLVFTTQPSGAVSGRPITGLPVLEARDNFGNVDRDFNNRVSTREGDGEGDLRFSNATWDNGVLSYYTAIYYATKDNETFTMRVSVTMDGEPLTAESDPVTADVVAQELRFAQQPVVSEPVSGMDAVFTTVPVVRAVNFYGLLDTGYSKDITLSVEGSGATTLSASNDLDSEADTVTITPINGVAEFAGLTLNGESASVTDIRLVASAPGVYTNQSDAITVIEASESSGVNANAQRSVMSLSADGDSGQNQSLPALTEGGETWYAARPGLLSVPATRDQSPGVVEHIVPGMGDLIAYSVLFEDDEGKLMQQDFVPVPADWTALRAAIRALPGVDSVRIDEQGIITVELDGQEVRGLMAYTVVGGGTTREDTVLIEQGDLTGNGAMDFEVHYPDGRRQRLYLYP